MNKLLISILLFLSATLLFSQEVVFETTYSKLPFKLQIENSGIYSIASFDVDNESIYFSSFTKPGIFKASNIGFTSSNIHEEGNDFIVDINILGKVNEPNDKSYRETILLKKNYWINKSVLRDNGGMISGSNGERITIAVPSRNSLIINNNLKEIKNEMVFDFSNNLACADLIGIDRFGNMFVVIEKYKSKSSFGVNREVLTISKNGNILSQLLLPTIKYLYTLKDLQIDSEGNLYHLLSYSDKVEIVKWNNLTAHNGNIINYPKEYNKNIHFNDFVTNYEPQSDVNKYEDKILSGVSRTEALRIADTYVLHQYECTSSNLAPSNITAPDGDVIRTPDWLIVGMNARIPYKWGGFNTIAQFDAGLANGRYAGDINTDGVSSYAVGVDCSGYVSRCWQLSYHASTAYMPNITTQYTSWDELKPGDAIHKVGHVRLFVERNINGSLKVVEAASRIDRWDVSYWSYQISDLSAYTPRYYNNMESNNNNNRPTLLSAELNAENLILLKWDCDTVDVMGYRVYYSWDDENWQMVLDENSCKTTNAEIGGSRSDIYFRVSSVKNDSPEYSESNWSNVLGVNSKYEKNALIVDGFSRENGSWRGPGHTFVGKYGQAIAELNVGFNSMQTSELQNGLFNLGDYDYVFWISGDESTVDETFNSIEQSLVEDYLEHGGSFFVSGSEIGWDLFHKGSEKDKDFYNNYLKANYLSDEAGYPTSAIGIENTVFDGCELNFGQTYEEDYPDEIEPINGSALCMNYANGKGAGIFYNGQFGNTNLTEIRGNLIYLAFPLETTADDSSFNKVISNTILYFKNSPTSIESNHAIIKEFRLSQNYPNPFNPSTTIKYSIPSIVGNEHAQSTTDVSLKIYDILGKEVATLVNKQQKAGNYEVNFDASNLSSGLYFYRFSATSVGEAQSFVDVKKMLLVK